MLAKRIIPCLDIKNGRTVKGVNFKGLRDAGDPIELAKRYSEEGADELVFLDITATNEKRKTLIPLVEQIARHINIPFTVGGGIKSEDEIAILLQAGADKISLNSSIVRDPAFISRAADRFGSQCIVAAIDSKRVNTEWNVFINAGQLNTGRNTLEWCKEVAERGAGEIMLTSMDRDGTKSGFDNEILKTISENVSIPLIASGGAGSIDHCIDAVKVGKADAVLAASIFHYREIEITDLKKTFLQSGIPVRTIF
ncbi:MAG: imidazole glycerol phosphate synthase subunit HisF [Balneolales bacterium]